MIDIVHTVDFHRAFIALFVRQNHRIAAVTQGHENLHRIDDVFVCERVFTHIGRATETEGLKKVCIVGGGVGCAIALPIARKLHSLGCEVDAVIGFRNKDLVILEDEFRECSSLTVTTDDGSHGRKGVTSLPLKEKLESGEKYDAVIAIGPLIMMKATVETVRPFGTKVIVSMNPIMIDGTGMCGGCRLTVGGKTRFACIDGPDFDGYEVDFDEAMMRNTAYREFETSEREKHCELFRKEVK